MTTQDTKDALSSTPRTDAVARPHSALHGDAPDYVTGSFSRQLERELNEALDKVIELSIGNIDLRAENTRLRTRLREIEIANYGHSDEAQS